MCENISFAETFLYSLTQDGYLQLNASRVESSIKHEYFPSILPIYTDNKYNSPKYFNA